MSGKLVENGLISPAGEKILKMSFNNSMSLTMKATAVEWTYIDKFSTKIIQTYSKQL